MKAFLDSMTLMIAIIFAENYVLSLGHGATELVYVSRKPKVALFHGAVMTVATTISAIFCWGFGKFICNRGLDWTVQALIFMVYLAILYLVFIVVLKRFFSKFFEVISKGFTVTLINSLVFSMPFIIAFHADSLISSIILGVGAGLSFVVAAVLLSFGQKTMDNPDVPRVFKGMPLQFIYLGILSMVFFAFSGKM